jgi:mRNA interferase MazF
LVDPDSVRDQAEWVPERGEVIWINCNPQAGREMRDRHPLLVLSPRNFNERTSLVIGLPMTTAAYNADNPFAIAVGRRPKHNDQSAVSYVLCHQPKSFDWRVRRAEPHPLVPVTKSAFARVCARLNQIIEIA